MIYAYDQGVQLPISSIYDTQMMLAQVSYAKDMYEKAAQEMKDFKKEFGDFYSPIQKDMEWYGKNVTGRIQNVINDLYARGIDPTRSAEGRAVLHRELNNIDTATIAQMKQAAAHRNAYNTAAMKDENYNKEFSDWVFSQKHNNVSPDQWDTSTMGIFPEVAPARFKTLNDIVDPVIKNVDFTYDDSMTKQMNDGNDYYTITTDRMMKAFSDNLPDIMNTPQGAWYYDQALTATNGDKDAAKALMVQQMADRVSAAERVKKQADPFKKAEFEAKLSRQTHAANAAIDHFYREKESENDLTRAIALEGVKNNNKTAPSIFDNAKSSVPKAEGKSWSSAWKEYTKSGRPVQYILDEQYSQGIDPLYFAGQFDAKDKNSGQVVTKYTFTGATLKLDNAVMHRDNNGYMYNVNMNNLDDDENVTFIPSGSMVGLHDFNTEYYISGKLMSGDKTVADNIWIPVVDRGGNYGYTQKKY